MMKKTVLALIMLTFLVSSAFGAGSSNTGTLTKRGGGQMGDWWIATFSWVADDTDGSIPDETLTGVVGYIARIVTDPGATAPSDNYDILLNDAYGCDLAGGELANRDTANTEQVIPKIGNAYGGTLIPGQMTCSISGNSVNSATGVVYVFIVPIKY